MRHYADAALIAFFGIGIVAIALAVLYRMSVLEVRSDEAALVGASNVQAYRVNDHTQPDSPVLGVVHTWRAPSGEYCALYNNESLTCWKEPE